MTSGNISIRRSCFGQYIPQEVFDFFERLKAKEYS